MSVTSSFDYVLVGGGLQTTLIALALRARRPASTIAVVEKAETLGGNHTWSFHAGDVSARALGWMEPLVAHRWPAHDVAFPSFARTIAQAYASIPSARVDGLVRAALASSPGSSVYTGSTAVAVEARSVTLACGRRLDARLVVDARGPDSPVVEGGAGFQKFLGLELVVSSPLGLDRPCLMDATVPQSRGFRFVYTLPLAADRILVEDTYFSDSPDLDREGMRARVMEYARARGWRDPRVVREETGVLPLPWRGAPPRPRRSPLQAGYAGGWFHPVTGYSLPVAVRLAEHLSDRPAEEAFGPDLDRLAREHRRQARFARLLNGLMFGAYPPEERWHVLERFYRLPDPTIARFYALRLRAVDRLRILGGRPPRGLSLRLAWSRLALA
ncbi:MAG TPA: lycopene beta-cyclase CrtY [Vicinamibacteria bacterium]